MSEGRPVRIHARHGSVRGISVMTLWLQNTSRGSGNQQEQIRTLNRNLILNVLSVGQGKGGGVRRGVDSPRGVG